MSLGWGFLTAQIFILLIVDFISAIPIDNSLVLRVQNTEPIVLRSELVCTGATVDLMFIIDGSTSIGDENFNLVRNFLARVASKLPEDSHVSTIQFSGTPRTEFSFNAFTSNAERVAYLKQMPYKRGTTKVGLAIKHALTKELLEEKGDRPDVVNIIIVLTDGRSEDDPTEQAKLLRQNGNTVLVVGVTDLIDREQLRSVAGSEDNIFEVADFSQLNEDLEGQILSNQECRTIQITEIPSGEPMLEIDCGPDAFSVAADTRNPFEGQVYVKNQYENPNCVKSFDGTDTVADIQIPFNECGTTRRRSLNPPGIFVENTVVFKFHPQMLTKVDQTFKVQCFYMDAMKTVINDLGPVQELTTGLATGNFEMPRCEYSVRKGSPEGEPVTFALVGDQVYHRWECEDSDSIGLFKMTVYDCYADDGRGNRLQVINEQGCSTDKYLIGNLDYDPDRLLVTKEAHVFKFADKPQVFFQCQINLCVNLPDYDGEFACQDTPPDCTGAEPVPTTTPPPPPPPRRGSARGRTSGRFNARTPTSTSRRGNSNNRRGQNQTPRRRVGRSIHNETRSLHQSLDVLTDYITVLDNANHADFAQFHDRWTNDRKGQMRDNQSEGVPAGLTRRDCISLAQIYTVVLVAFCVIVVMCVICIVQFFTTSTMNRLRFAD